MGGKVAMTTALKFPDLIERLIVLDVAPVETHFNDDTLQYIQ